MKRRKFIQSISLAGAAPILLNGIPLQTMGRSALIDLLGEAEDCEDRVLVMIQLNGGNDGLHTIVPVNQYENLKRARPNIILPENSLLGLNGVSDNKLHPSMTGLQTLYNDSKIAVVQNVGYPNQDFSHFRSTDIWLTASGSDKTANTGWLGRYLDGEHPIWPQDYPNPENPDPLAIQVGFIVSPAFHGPKGMMGYAINDVDEFYQLVTDTDPTDTSTPYGHELAFLRQTARQTNEYSQRVKNAAEAQANLSTLYPEEGENTLADQLKVVARMIGGGLKTKLYMVSIGGFDTHAEQVEPGANTTGAHADLLKKVSDAMLAFQDDIEKMQVSERVLTMTFSEFGRRIASNGSLGTDHGAAAPLLLMSNGINTGIIGSNPIIPDAVQVNDNLPMEVDYRSVYGSVLRDWFCVDEETVKEVLLGDFQLIPLRDPSGVNNLNFSSDLKVYPNPASDVVQVELSVPENMVVHMEFFNTSGLKVKSFRDIALQRGANIQSLPIRDLAGGAYTLRIYNRRYSQMTRVLKMR